MRRFIPRLIATITGVDRYFPELKWADKPSWTHNVFRVYEQICGRREGVKVELAGAAGPDGKAYFKCYSWEGMFVLAEMYIRNWIASRKFTPFKIQIPRLDAFFQKLAFDLGLIPVMQTPQGIPFYPEPAYKFAIALDTTGTLYALNTWSLSFTCTGSNLLMTVGFNCTGATDPYTSIKYNNVQMTAINTNNNYAGTEWAYHYQLIAPATGAHTVDIVSFNTWGTVISYSGVKQTGFPDSTATGVGTTATTITASTTVVASNCWLTMTLPFWQANSSTAGTGTTIRGTQSNRAMYDSNGTVGTGSQSLVATCDINPVGSYYSIVSIAPFVAASGPANLKSYNTNLTANIKSIVTNLIANVKSLDTNV